MTTRWLRRLVMAAVGLLVIASLLWTLRQVSLTDLGSILSGIGWMQIGVLLALNVFIFLLFCLRWSLFLPQDHTAVPFMALVRYRLTAFGIHYFTPGPQFGGEPYQVYVLRRHHQVPLATAISAVTLDRLVELMANLGFLLLGLGVALSTMQVWPLSNGVAWLPTALLFALPMVYLLALWVGYTPLTRLTQHLAAHAPALAFLERAGGTLAGVEHAAGSYCRQKPGRMGMALLLSAVTWVALIIEFRLALTYLGLPVSVPQAIAVLTAARMAFLMPTPAGLGALEAGQVMAMGALGFSPAFGISMSLLIRARDVLLGGFGLLLGGWGLMRLLGRRMDVRSPQNIPANKPTGVTNDGS